LVGAGYAAGDSVRNFQLVCQNGVQELPQWQNVLHGRLVPLLDMLKVKAREFAGVVGDLGEFRFKVSETLHFKPELGNQPPPKDLLADVRVFLGEAHAVFEDIGCDHTSDMAGFYLAVKDEQFHFSSLQSALDGMMISLISELNAKRIFQLTGDNAKLYSESPVDLFGKDVSNAFPSAVDEIQEAGNCIALSRWPASAFHLMRVLERGLSVLAAKFEVSADHTNWHNIIEQIETRVRKIDPEWGSDWKDQQRFYSEAARHFMFLKDGWRNHVMHVREVYDEGRALSVWQHTKEFMQQIAKRLHE
jgi:hypothetical protein